MASGDNTDSAGDGAKAGVQDQPQAEKLVASALVVAGTIGGGWAQTVVPNSVPLTARLVLLLLCISLGLTLAAAAVLLRRQIDSLDRRLVAGIWWTGAFATLMSVVLGLWFWTSYRYTINPRCEKAVVSVPSTTTGSDFTVTTRLRCVPFGRVAVTVLELHNPATPKKAPLYYVSWATPTGREPDEHPFRGLTQGPGIRRTFFVVDLKVEDFVALANDPDVSFGAAHSDPAFVQEHFLDNVFSNLATTITTG